MTVIRRHDTGAHLSVPASALRWGVPTNFPTFVRLKTTGPAALSTSPRA